MTLSFPRSLDAAWEQIRSWLEPLRQAWPNLQVHEEILPHGTPWRWIYAPARRQPQRVLMLGAGLHGIEGHVGVAILDLFLREFAPHLDAAVTDLYLIPVANPWGMAHGRRVNANNVDLNRNFLADQQPFPRIDNPAYEKLYPFLNPQGPVRRADRWRFWLRGLKAIAQAGGPSALRSASLQGQSQFPEGIFYTGQDIEPETHNLQRLISRAFQRPQVLYIDIHTGYGPKHQLSIVVPEKEPRTNEELAQQLSYPHIDRVRSETFYRIQGDLGGYLMRRGQALGVPTTYLGFEFGTWGASLAAQLRSLRAMVLENQLHRFGAEDPSVAAWVRQEFRDLFFPQDPEWRRAAETQARQAFRGVLRAFA
ncbi:MAG: DUF2817 domain-containing protein [Chloroflexi bacterium]|nr:DUF2817 domain-containing protein [Chloroflexota bacterium]